MLSLYQDKEDYVLCDHATRLVGNWCSDPIDAVRTFYKFIDPCDTHSVFSRNKYTLISTYNSYTTLTDFQQHYPELFI